jgi:parallel beta-helix repeat protein
VLFPRIARGLLTIISAWVTPMTLLPGKETMAQPALSACGSNLVVSQSTQLAPGCRYTGTTVITGSDLVLDCRGATLDAEYKASPALLIGGRHGVSRVEVRNCVVIGGRLMGVAIGLSNSDAPDLYKPDGQPDRSRFPREIVLRNMTVRRNATVGIYVLDYVQDVTITASLMEENGSTGLYLDRNSLRSRVIDNRILNNGGGGNSGVPLATGGTREGIAIDGASNNLIEKNILSGNRSGGIFLYRNCGEQPKKRDEATRWPPARGNIIRDNEISSGGVGVWLASRQEYSVDPAKCMLRVDPARGLFTDAAPGNTVTGNRISGMHTGIRVADNDNTVRDNRIDASRDCLLVGSEQRERFGHPVENLRIQGNQCVRGKVTVSPATEMAPNNGPLTR